MTSLGLSRFTRSAAVPLGNYGPEPDRLRVVRNGYCAAVIAAAALQLMFFMHAEDNLLSTLLALVSSVLGINHALNGQRFRAQPISALILLFYTTTATSGALLVKTIEWSPVSDSLLVPVTTFSVMLATQVVLLVADRIYMRFEPLHQLRRFLTARALVPLHMMRWPTDRELWMLGAIGCISVLAAGTDYESGASFGMANAGAKLIRAFGFLKFAPFLIPFRDALGGIPRRVHLRIVPLALFFVALVGISFATNSRSTFADAVPTIAICVLAAQAMGRMNLRRVPPMRLVLFGLGAALAGVLLTRVALAMVVVRDYRYSVDVGMLMRLTIEALFNNEWLAAAKAKMDTEDNIGNYSEVYVNSRFAARFLLTKYHDNMLYYFSLCGPDHIHSYAQFMWTRLFASLPDPLLRLVGVTIDKQDLTVSNGDYLVYIVDGWGMGGFKTGSMISEVFVVFGWAFPLVIVACALMLFVSYDAFVTPTAMGRVAFSPLIILLIWNLVGTTAAFGFGAETVTAIPSGVLRGLPQSVLVYAIAVALVRGLNRITGGR